MTDLNNRSVVKNIFIESVDGLKDFPAAINSIFPKTEVQLCIVHQISNSLRYVASKNQKEFTQTFVYGIHNTSKKWTMPLWNWSLTIS